MSVSLCWGLISTLDVLILSVLQRRTWPRSDHTSALQNNRLHVELLLSGTRACKSAACVHTKSKSHLCSLVANLESRHTGASSLTRVSVLIATLHHFAHEWLHNYYNRCHADVHEFKSPHCIAYDCIEAFFGVDSLKLHSVHTDPQSGHVFSQTARIHVIYFLSLPLLIVVTFLLL